jgi:DNA-binding SARP family transcriptional activator/tetratricopeptide (TPR) repeat protein
VVRYAILGPIELCDGKRTVTVGGPRQLALLALLLVNANRALSDDRLIDTLWHDLGPSGALKRLQAAILRLRRSLDPDGVQPEPVLRRVAGGYLLAVAPGELDADVFQARIGEARRALEAGEAALARDVLCDALGMWRGPALAEVAYVEFAQPEIRRLEELRLTALEARVDCELRLGEHGGLISELAALVAAHPGRERLAAQLMLAMYRCGRQGEALEVYARTRAILLTELGLEPGPALQTLQAEILAQAPALQSAADAPGPAARDNAAAADVLPTGVVTFLLTDVEGSTRLWEADADAMAGALEVHDGLIARLVERHGGRLLKGRGEGDATLSVFERASDAVACAAELQRALATAPWPSPLDLRTRIALHSGEALERTGDYLGPVLNRAARLRSLATGGQIVVSRTTTELVLDRLPEELAVVDLGRHELQGLSRPERVFELRTTARAGAEESDVASGSVMLALPRSLHVPAKSPFVGRDAELGRLRERWTELCEGTRSAVVLGGEAGIGKTRLASELAQIAHEQGALVLYGRCDEGLDVPYQPFVEALRPYARAVGLDWLGAELGDLACELGRLLPELVALGTPVRADPESERFALFEAVAALVEAATRERPALMVLDDLHWAARPTLLLLRHLIRSERTLGALLLCTYRETELDPGQPLARLLADLHRDSSATHLRIRGLDEAAVAVLLEAELGRPIDERTSELAHVLRAQTAGNPLFLRELLAQVAESYMTSADGKPWSASVTAEPLEVSEGLRYLIGNRVARLSAPAARALSVAAVAGARFSFVLLEHVLGERSGVLDALDETVAAGLLREAEHGDYVFAHALVHQTIYRQLGSARRVRLHRRLGEALEALYDTHTPVEALAHHFAQAAPDGQGVKAATYALAAGRSATARLAYEQAAAHCERGLEALVLSGQSHDQRRCELLLALGEASWDAGELDKARQAYAEACELAERVDDSTSLARAALGFCGPHRFEVVGAMMQPVDDLLERTLAALGEEDSALRARLTGALAAYTGDAKRKPVLARRALEMARRVADKATLADVLASNIWTTRGPDTLHESVAMATELGHVADEVGDHRLRVRAHRWLVDFLLELGDIEAVERELDALQRKADTRIVRYFRWLLTVFRANHAHLGGRLEQCERLAHDALAHRFEGRDEIASHTFAAQMLVVRREQGRLDELVPSIEDVVAEYPQFAGWRCTLAYIYAQLERRAQAREELEALVHADFCDVPRDAFWLWNMSMLCEVVVFLGDAPRARLLYKLLLPYTDRCVVLVALLCQGSAARPLGLLATTLSHYDDAARHFEHALRMNAQIRSPLWIARTQHEYARMLLLRRRPGDRDKARRLLTEALTAADQFDLKALADKARPLKCTAEAAPT